MKNDRDDKEQNGHSRARMQEQLKANYKRLEEDFKQKEKRLERAKDKIKAACVQLSLAAEGQDENFDELLLELRKALQSQEPGPSILSRLESAAQGIAAIRRKRAEQFGQSLMDVTKQLLELSPPESTRNQLNDYADKLHNENDTLNEYGTWLEQYSRLQKDVFSALGDSNLSPTEKEKIDATSDNSAITMPSNVVSFPEFSAVANSIESTLLEMLDKMTMSSAAKQELEKLRAIIDAGLNWYELAVVLEQLGELVRQVLDRDHGDIERFLENLNESLADVNQQLQRAHGRHRAFSECTTQFTDELRRDIDQLQAQASEEKPVDSLKAAVSIQVEEMKGRLNQFNEEHNLYTRLLIEEVDKLQDKIKTLENEVKENQSILAEQREKSLLDSLTQLPNREAYDERITTEFARWQRYRRPLSLAVVDVDHFKLVNDNYGHLAGDNVLRILASTLTKRLRRTDYIARYGGEEFVVVMPETALIDAVQVMEQVREKVATTPFHFNSEPLTITVSCGLATFAENDDIAHVFERADQQLYAAKNGGRNQCCAA